MAKKRKNILITGAGRGLGFSITKTFFNNQWNVIPFVRSEKDAIKLKKMFNDQCFPIISDVTRNDVDITIGQELKKIGNVDVLINNAGTGGQGSTLAETTVENVLSLIDIHCLGVLRISKAVLPFLKQNAIVINISSRFGSIAEVSTGQLDHISCSYAYRIAKAAQNMLTQCMCREFSNSGIRIFSVHPGLLKTGTCSADAKNTSDEAAEKLFQLLDYAEHGQLYNLFEGTLDW